MSFNVTPVVAQPQFSIFVIKSKHESSGGAQRCLRERAAHKH